MANITPKQPGADRVVEKPAPKPSRPWGNIPPGAGNKPPAKGGGRTK